MAGFPPISNISFATGFSVVAQHSHDGVTSLKLLSHCPSLKLFTVTVDCLQQLSSVINTILSLPFDQANLVVP